MILRHLIRRPHIRSSSWIGILLLALLSTPLLSTGGNLTAQDGPTTRFQVSFSPESFLGAVTGRVFVMISRTTEREPRLQIGRDGTPFFGQDVVGLEPGDAGIIDGTTLGDQMRTFGVWDGWERGERGRAD